jgi:hypothetical protein
MKRISIQFPSEIHFVYGPYCNNDVKSAKRSSKKLHLTFNLLTGFFVDLPIEIRVVLAVNGLNDEILLTKLAKIMTHTKRITDIPRSTF